MSSKNHHLNSPLELKTILKKIKRFGGFTQENADELTTFIKNNGWCYGLLFFDKPRETPFVDIIDVNAVDGNFATLINGNSVVKMIPMYTNKDYAYNLKDHVSMPNYHFGYLCKITIASMLAKAQAMEIEGLILNPQTEGITVKSAK